MRIRLINFLRKNKLLFCYQFSFRSGYSINQALTSLTELIRKALDEDKFACGIFIDLQEAFDTVDRKILLSKLYHCGVKGAPHDLAGKSSVSSIRYGVPQGSMLGPLLFLLYINDLNKAGLHSKVHYFADDSNFLYASHSI